MSPSDDLVVSGAPGANQDHQDVRSSIGDRFLPYRTQGSYQHPKIRSLVAKHCEQLSSELADVFRADLEREVKQRVSEVIVSEATVFCEQLKSKDDALLAAETRCRGLREQLELSDQMCCKLQERVKQLEATEAELRVTLDKRLEDVRGFILKSCTYLHSSLSVAAAAVGGPVPARKQTSHGYL